MLPQIPKDWDAIDAWEAYYREYCAEERWKSWLSLEDLGWSFVSQFAERQHRSIWFPGCGASLAPRLYAALGFDVLASDVSASALDFQRWVMEQPLSELGVSRIIEDATGESLDDEPCPFELLSHDLKDSIPREFDAVINHLSYHGFTAAHLPTIAATHYNATRPGGMAIFVMGNVSRSKRESIEQPLADAGFYIPYFASESWFRGALQASQLPHRFISNRVSLRIDEEPFRSDKTKREAAQKKLDAIEAEYNQRMRAEDPSITKNLEDPTLKTAFLIYG